MNHPIPIVALIILVCLDYQALAEREVEPTDDASHVVTGIVSKVFTRSGDENDEFLISIRIARIEKGAGYKNGDTIFAYVFQRKADAPLEPAASGHDGVPDEGQRIRARIKRGKGGMEGLYPYWFDVLDTPETEDEAEQGKNQAGPKPHPQRLEGMKEALADLENGVLKQKEYPPEPYGPGRIEFIRLLKATCGVEWEVINTKRAPLPETSSHDALRQNIDGYNDVMRVEIESRFGRDIFAKLTSEASKR